MNDSRSREAELEELTQAYGREIFERARHEGPVPFGSAWWDERLMEWTMGDEAVKVQLFRFIDVLPMLTAPSDIARHVREYFTLARDHLPRWAKAGLRWMPNNGWAGSLVARAARWNAERLARRFIAGTNVPETLAAVANLRRQGLAFTVDLLGEATVTEAEAERYQAEYFNLIDGLSTEVNAWTPIDSIDTDDRGPLSRVNLSIKLSSLYSQFDPVDPTGTSALVSDRLRPILRAARRRVPSSTWTWSNSRSRTLHCRYFARSWRKKNSATGRTSASPSKHTSTTAPGISRSYCAGSTGGAPLFGSASSRARTGTTRPYSPPNKTGQRRSSVTSGKQTPASSA